MAKYRVTICRSARKELEQLDPMILERIFPKIEALAENPYPPGCLKIQGQKNLWRIRVGDYRVIYSVSEEEKWVDIIAVRHRSKAYRF
ncbi:MAG: type II toxin-antitoxin system RelE/ParE family toxin [Candidatus Parabeggiatoa sp. nov. 3]|jgi:mRNA interferase RelE/StbE|nr:MAG: type II toxin-antitoxin system RelE/ParE family toxin [Gammaproteobacteria bacterium]RKZ64719.1 MAG: type II toxin-antitoxin system RelE/ParE family toxin [Gammaproteobacteria bacterium]RKZ85175.1 MAG: type II toxin-antitoxin system RelE/ParE family toxin [Gammaproteobacteria bacterium]HEW98396.1 type II toxin-antitoxin system RelE/ParE family toxin [Beggiatoa sp.]